MSLFHNLPYRVAAIATVAALSTTTSANADTAGNIAGNLKGQIGTFGQLVVAGGFLAGLFFVAAGLMKLKQAADDGGQRVRYTEGFWRLGVGIGLIAIPAITGVGLDTFGFGNSVSITPGGGESF